VLNDFLDLGDGLDIGVFENIVHYIVHMIGKGGIQAGIKLVWSDRAQSRPSPQPPQHVQTAPL
jgi:hypothetical protein